MVEVSVVLPVRDERDSLARLDLELRRALAAMGRPSEIIYVDDHSGDGSPAVLRELLAALRPRDIRTRIVTLRHHCGQTAALAAGIDLAEGEIVVPLDSDGQNNPADIPRLVEKLERGFDVVSGWRRSRKDLLFTKKIPSWLANRLAAKVTGVRIHDFGCTLKAYRAAVLREVKLYGDMHRFLPAFLAPLGARIGELEVDHRPRLAGTSKYGTERIVKVLVDLVLIRFMTRFYSRPMHFFGQLGALFLVAVVAVGLLMLVLKYGWLSLIGIDYQASFIETPLPALAATFFLGIVSSIFFGILGEILIRIHHESSGLSAYAVETIEDSKEEAT